MFFASCVLHTMPHEHDARYDHSFEHEEFENADEIDEEGDDEDVPTPPPGRRALGQGGGCPPVGARRGSGRCSGRHTAIVQIRPRRDACRVSRSPRVRVDYTALEVVCFQR